MNFEDYLKEFEEKQSYDREGLARAVAESLHGIEERASDIYWANKIICMMLEVDPRMKDAMLERTIENVMATFVLGFLIGQRCETYKVIKE